SDDHNIAKPYRGFRRLFELMALPAQFSGVRIAHLYHARSNDSSGWYEERDRARSRFHEQVLPLLDSRAHLLDYDWMPRRQRAPVRGRQETHAGAFCPLRMEGYALVRALADGIEVLARADALLATGEIGAVAILNPYMRSRASVRPLFERAKQRGIRAIVF